MKLSIEISGQMERIVITSLPKRFLAKIFKHCMGKNNTPYFVSNCLKGVLYFDIDLAKSFAESIGYNWKEWPQESRFFQTDGFCFERYLDISVNVNGSLQELAASEVITKIKQVDLDNMLSQVEEDEVLIVMGAVDKGSEFFVLDDIDEPFEPEELMLELVGLENFQIQEQIIRGITYKDQSLRREQGRVTGKNMLAPLLFSRNGEELDMYDFVSEDTTC